MDRLSISGPARELVNRRARAAQGECGAAAWAYRFWLLPLLAEGGWEYRRRVPPWVLPAPPPPGRPRVPLTINVRWPATARISSASRRACCTSSLAKQGRVWVGSSFSVLQITHPVPQLQATPFEVCLDAPLGFVGVCAGGDGVAPAGRGFHHLQHVLGIGLPVGGQVQQAIGGHARGEQGDESGLDQAALVMALLVPGVGEPDARLGQRRGGDFVLQHLDRVVP